MLLGGSALRDGVDFSHAPTPPQKGPLEALQSSPGAPCHAVFLLLKAHLLLSFCRCFFHEKDNGTDTGLRPSPQPFPSLPSLKARCVVFSRIHFFPTLAMCSYPSYCNM